MEKRNGYALNCMNDKIVKGVLFNKSRHKASILYSDALCCDDKRILLPYGLF